MREIKVYRDGIVEIDKGSITESDRRALRGAFGNQSSLARRLKTPGPAPGFF